MSDPGTLFPSDTGGPGDAEAGADITGQVLPPLNPSPMDLALAAGTGSSLPSAPGGPAEAGDAPTQVAGGQIDPPQGRKARTSQDRINQLTRQYRQEQRARGEIESQLAETLNILHAQGEEIKALRSGRQASPAQRAANEAADALGLAATPEGAAAPVTLDAVRGVVQATFADYEARARQRDAEIAQIRASQEQAFMEAVEEMPELRDTRSRARQYFDQIYAVSPLNKLPDAPYQIALQVQGILAREAAQTPSPQRVVQAGVVVPAGAPVDANSQAAARAEFGKLTQQIKAGNNDFTLYRRWRQLRGQLGSKR